MYLSLQRIGSYAGKGNCAVTRITIELCCGTVIFGKAMLQRIIGDSGQSHGIPEGLLQERVQILSGFLFNNQPQ